MAIEIKDAYQSMNFSTERLNEVLNAAKQSDAKKFNERDLQIIEELLRKLDASFSKYSAESIMGLKAVKGTCKGKDEKLQEIASQYQTMEALIANMTQTMIGMESIRSKFNEIYGSNTGLLSSLERSQSTAEAARLALTSSSLNHTKESLDRTTELFKKQLNEEMAAYEEKGAQYYAMMSAAFEIKLSDHTEENGEPDDNNGDEQNNDENAENQAEEQENVEQTEAEEQTTEEEQAELDAQTDLVAQAAAEADALAAAEAEQAELDAQAEADALAEAEAEQAELDAQAEADALAAAEAEQAELDAQAEADALAEAEAEQAELDAQAEADALAAAEAEQAELDAQAEAEALADAEGERE